MMTFNAMSKSWTGRLSAVTLTFRRLPSVASGQYYESVLNQAGYTLAVPCFGLKNGVHLTHGLEPVDTDKRLTIKFHIR